MSAADRAAELRAQADTLDAVAELEAGLLSAKEAHAAAPSAETRAPKQAAAQALREMRALEREGRADLVGGDAFVSNGSQG